MSFSFVIQARQICEVRCCYCNFITPQRSVLYKHLGTQHEADYQREENGVSDAYVKCENLSRRGARLFGPERFEKLLTPMRSYMDPPTYNRTKEIVKEILAHALVVVHSELFTGRRYCLLKAAFSTMNE